VDAVRKGLDKLLLNTAALERDLEAQWPVVAEGIQTILRRAGYPEPYERLKDLTRGKERITQQDIADFIERLDVSEEVKAQLRRLTPHNYTGIDLFAHELR
jgi:adenylosuccinate lyase